MPRSKRAVGYARVSSAEQALGSSLVDQQNAIAAYAKARGMNIATFYVESGSAVREKIEHRVQMQALLRDVREGDLVLCDKLDRWSRDPEFSYSSIRQILEKGARFYAVGDACDPSTPEGDTMLNFRVLFAREEHKRIKQRMVGTRQILRDQGYWVEGPAPYGYQRSAPKGTRGVAKNVLVVVPEQAEIVRRVFRLCIGGKPIQQIGDVVGLSKYHAHHILRNRAYLGLMKDSRGEWAKGRHEALLDAETFKRAAEALEARKQHGARYRTGFAETHDWVLRDVAVCALCGAKMGAAYAGPPTARRHYFKCTSKCAARYVPVIRVERDVDALVFARLVQIRAELAKGPDAKPAVDASDFVAELAAISRRHKRVLDMYEDGAINRTEMQRRLARLDAQRLGVEAKRDDATRPMPLADAETRRALLGELRIVETVWKRANRVQKRAMVGLLAEAVRLEANHAPVPQWYSAEALAEDVAPVNISAGVTCSPRRDVDSRFAQVFASIGVLH